MLNAIDKPGLPSAPVIAAFSEPTPLLRVLVTVGTDWR